MHYGSLRSFEERRLLCFLIPLYLRPKSKAMKPHMTRAKGKSGNIKTAVVKQCFTTAVYCFTLLKMYGSAYSRLLYSAAISSTEVSRGLPGRQASA